MQPLESMDRTRSHTPSSPSGRSPSIQRKSRSAVQSSLRGLDFAAQEALLAPVQRKSSQSTVANDRAVQLEADDAESDLSGDYAKGAERKPEEAKPTAQETLAALEARDAGGETPAVAGDDDEADPNKRKKKGEGNEGPPAVDALDISALLQDAPISPRARLEFAQGKTETERLLLPNGQVVTVLTITSGGGRIRQIEIDGEKTWVDEPIYEKVVELSRNKTSFSISESTTDRDLEGRTSTETDKLEAKIVADKDKVGVTGGSADSKTVTNADGSETNQGTSVSGSMLLDRSGKLTIAAIRQSAGSHTDAEGTASGGSRSYGGGVSISPGGSVNASAQGEAMEQKGQVVGGLSASGAIGTDGVQGEAQGKVGLKGKNASATAGLGPTASYKAEFAEQGDKSWKVSAVTMMGLKGGVEASASKGGDRGIKAGVSGEATATYRETETLSRDKAEELYGAITEVRGKNQATGLAQIKAMWAHVGSIVRAIEAVLAHLQSETSIGHSDQLADLGEDTESELVTKVGFSATGGGNVKGISAGGGVAMEWVKAVKAKKRKAKAGDLVVKSGKDGAYQKVALTADQAKAVEIVELEVTMQDAESWNANGGFALGAAGMTVGGGKKDYEAVSYLFHLDAASPFYETVRSSVANASDKDGLEQAGRRSEPAKSCLQKIVTKEGTESFADVGANTGPFDAGIKHVTKQETALEQNGDGAVEKGIVSSENTLEGTTALGPIWENKDEDSLRATSTADPAGVTTELSFSNVESSAWFGGWASSQESSLRKAEIDSGQFEVICSLAGNDQVWHTAAVNNPNVMKAWIALGAELVTPSSSRIEAILAKADGYSNNEDPWASFTAEQQDELRKVAVNVVKAQALADFVANGAYPPRHAHAVMFNLTDRSGYNLTNEYAAGGGSYTGPWELQIRRLAPGERDDYRAKELELGEQLAALAKLPKPDQWVFDSRVVDEDTYERYSHRDFSVIPQADDVDGAGLHYRLTLEVDGPMVAQIFLDKGITKADLKTFADPEKAWKFCRSHLPASLAKCVKGAQGDRGEARPAGALGVDDALKVIAGWSKLSSALYDHVYMSSYDEAQLRVLTEMGTELLDWRNRCRQAELELAPLATVDREKLSSPEASLLNEVRETEGLVKKYYDEHVDLIDRVEWLMDNGKEDRAKVLWDSTSDIWGPYESAVHKLRRLYVQHGETGGVLGTPVTIPDDEAAKDATKNHEWQYRRLLGLARRRGRIDNVNGIAFYKRW